MIAQLTGKLSLKASSFCILNVLGVGYEVFLPIRTINQLPDQEDLCLFIYTYVREDQIKLYGFKTMEERQLFIQLLNVSGVGPKAAMSILSVSEVREIHQAIIQANVTFFTKIKGLGKKTAQKIIIELKPKIGSIQELDLSEKSLNVSRDVVEALKNFGFSRAEIDKTLASLDPNLSEDQLIKLSLQALGKT